eukprot:scaffold4.g4627.t1
MAATPQRLAVGSRGHTDLLRQFGLRQAGAACLPRGHAVWHRNPYTDRTAEKTVLDDVSLYVHSDLQGFKPSETTYIFFGRRGSGKTTIRMQARRGGPAAPSVQCSVAWRALFHLLRSSAPPLGPPTTCAQRQTIAARPQMMHAYAEHNELARASGKTRGHFVVDLSRPGHLTGCLRQFQKSIGASDDNWDAAFGEAWDSADMVDCIVSYAMTHLVDEMTDTQSVEGMDMLERVRLDPRASKQFLLLAHLYANTDSSSLVFLRRALSRPRFTALEVVAVAAPAAVLAGGAAAALRSPALGEAASRPLELAADELRVAAPYVADHPRLSLAALLGVGAAASYYARRYRHRRALERAAAVRVVKQQPTETLAALLNSLFGTADTAETIRGLYVGVSGHQKLDALSHLLRLLGFDSLAVFGDCFDEVVLLDPVQYPGAIKVFAREVCRNDLLNFGRMHWFFPDSRLSLDLSTDKTLKEARFDRHFVRDLTWSRHQLEELAERRFLAAQLQAQARAARACRHAQLAAAPTRKARRAVPPHPMLAHDGPPAPGGGAAPVPRYTFADLFKAVNMEDFSSYISKLSTPRELMIMMTDMEISCTRALEQAV